MDILQMVKAAQDNLRAAQKNWQEECLFECDDILTGVIRELEAAQAEREANMPCPHCGKLVEVVSRFSLRS